MPDKINHEDAKAVAQTIVDTISFAHSGTLGADFAGGALLGLFVELVIFAMTHQDTEAAKIAKIYNKLYLKLNEAKPGPEYSIDISNVQGELNSLAQYIYDHSTSLDKYASEIGQKFDQILQGAVVHNPSYYNCDGCGNPKTSCDCRENQPIEEKIIHEIGQRYLTMKAHPIHKGRKITFDDFWRLNGSGIIEKYAMHPGLNWDKIKKAVRANYK